MSKKGSVDPPASYLKESLQANADAQPLTVYCSLCPKWKKKGTAVEMRHAAYNHRQEKHPELMHIKPKIVKKKRIFSQAMTEERAARIDEERRQRMHALGIPNE